MSKLTACVPLAGVEVGIYVARGTATPAEVKAETGADYVVNGGLYDMAKQVAVCHLKAGGTVCAEDPYRYWGYAWDTGPDLAMALIPNAAKRNYICCVALIRDGKAEALHYGADLGGPRARTAMGIRDGCLCLFCTDTGMTPEDLQQELLAAGWDSAVMLDGGGSSQCDFPGGKITSTRKVHNYIWVKEKKEDKPVSTDVGTITQNFMTKNPCYSNGRTITPGGNMVHSTATPGADADAMRASWNKSNADSSVQFVLDDKRTDQLLKENTRAWHCGVGTSGKSANNTHIAFEICEPHETRLIPVNWEPLFQGKPGMDAWAIKRWQSELKRMGLYSGAIDGSFGPATKAATIKAQAALGLIQDGSVGQGTLAAAAKQDGSFMAYPVQDVQAYFEAVYARAVALSAYLCKKYGFTPETDVLCHSEGYTKGIASNHADVMHWFPRHGKTMDNFRADVKAYMNGTAPVFTPAVSTELEDAVSKLATADIITDTDYWKGGSYSTANVQALILKMAAKL